MESREARVTGRLRHRGRRWAAMLAAVSASCVAAALLPGAGSGARQSAQGCAEPVTVVDAAGANEFFGDDDPATPKQGNEIPRPDTFSGLAGSDRIQGYKCKDVLSGGEGPDLILAGSGDDVVHGGARSDPVIFGADGNDKLYGDPNVHPGGCKGDECEADNLNGGDGNDLLVGRFGRDTLNGHKGKDKCVGSPKSEFRGCEIVIRRKVGKGGKAGEAGGDEAPPVATATVLNIAVNHNKDLVHLWGTTTPHASTDTVYLVIQHKGASGDWGRVKWGCFGFGGDGRFAHDFGLSPAANYRAQARYGDPECPPVAYGPSGADSGLFNVN